MKNKPGADLPVRLYRPHVYPNITAWIVGQEVFILLNGIYPASYRLVLPFKGGVTPPRTYILARVGKPGARLEEPWVQGDRSGYRDTGIEIDPLICADWCAWADRNVIYGDTV